MLGLFPSGNKTRKLEFLLAVEAITGFGVSRDPVAQEPLVWKEAQAVCDLRRLDLKVPRKAVISVGGVWQPNYSVPNQRMVEAVQRLAREGAIGPDERVLFLHTGGLPSLHAFDGVLLGNVGVAAP